MSVSLEHLVEKYTEALKVQGDDAGKAEVLYKSIIADPVFEGTDLSPDFVKVRYQVLKNLGNVCSATGKGEEALEYVFDAIQLIPREDTMLLYKLGTMAVENDNYALARFAFETAFTQDPYNWLIINALMSTLAFIGDFDCVKDVANYALSLDSNNLLAKECLSCKVSPRKRKHFEMVPAVAKVYTISTNPTYDEFLADILGVYDSIEPHSLRNLIQLRTGEMNSEEGDLTQMELSLIQKLCIRLKLALAMPALNIDGHPDNSSVVNEFVADVNNGCSIFEAMERALYYIERFNFSKSPIQSENFLRILELTHDKVSSGAERSILMIAEILLFHREYFLIQIGKTFDHSVAPILQNVMRSLFKLQLRDTRSGFVFACFSLVTGEIAQASSILQIVYDDIGVHEEICFPHCKHGMVVNRSTVEQFLLRIEITKVLPNMLKGDLTSFDQANEIISSYGIFAPIPIVLYPIVEQFFVMMALQKRFSKDTKLKCHIVLFVMKFSSYSPSHVNIDAISPYIRSICKCLLETQSGLEPAECNLLNGSILDLIGSFDLSSDDSPNEILGLLAFTLSLLNPSLSDTMIHDILHHHGICGVLDGSFLKRAAGRASTSEEALGYFKCLYGLQFVGDVGPITYSVPVDQMDPETFENIFRLVKESFHSLDAQKRLSFLSFLQKMYPLQKKSNLTSDIFIVLQKFVNPLVIGASQFSQLGSSSALFFPFFETVFEEMTQLSPVDPVPLHYLSLLRIEKIGLLYKSDLEIIKVLNGMDTPILNPKSLFRTLPCDLSTSKAVLDNLSGFLNSLREFQSIFEKVVSIDEEYMVTELHLMVQLRLISVIQAFETFHTESTLLKYHFDRVLSLPDELDRMYDILSKSSCENACTSAIVTLALSVSSTKVGWIEFGKLPYLYENNASLAILASVCLRRINSQNISSLISILQSRISNSQYELLSGDSISTKDIQLAHPEVDIVCKVLFNSFVELQDQFQIVLPLCFLLVHFSPPDDTLLIELAAQIIEQFIESSSKNKLITECKKGPSGEIVSLCSDISLKLYHLQLQSFWYTQSSTDILQLYLLVQLRLSKFEEVDRYFGIVMKGRVRKRSIDRRRAELYYSVLLGFINKMENQSHEEESRRSISMDELDSISKRCLETFIEFDKEYDIILPDLVIVPYRIYKSIENDCSIRTLMHKKFQDPQLMSIPELSLALQWFSNQRIGRSLSINTTKKSTSQNAFGKHFLKPLYEDPFFFTSMQ